MEKEDRANPEAAPTRLYDKRENFSSVEFYRKLSDRIKSLNRPELSLLDFNTFCCQEDPAFRKLSRSEAAGHLDISGMANLFDVDYKTIYRMIQKGEIPAAKIGGVYRIPAAAILLHYNVGVWHNRENDQEARIQAMQIGNLSVLVGFDSSSSISRRWDSYVAKTLGQVESDLGWSDLVKQASSGPPQE